MSRSKRKAFTLVEMLVVISIIGVLASMLLPAIQAAREAARRTTCVSNQRECAKAITMYDTSKEFLPPSRSVYYDTGTNVIMHNWVYPVLAQLGREDIRDLIREVPPATNNQLALLTEENIPVLKCPSDPGAPQPATLSYVVNGGRANGQFNWDWIANGVFVDQGFDASNSGDPAVVRRILQSRYSLSDVHRGDGTSTTIMLSENIDAHKWYCAQMDFASPSRQQYSQILWFDPAPPANLGLNKGSQVDVNTFDAEIRYARPASFHPGGSIVAFCDGSTKFISDTIDYQVYGRLMSSEGKKADDPTVLTPSVPLPNPPWQGVLPIGNY